MKKLLLFCLLCYSVTWAQSHKLNGPSTSGGGNALVCRDNAGKILSSELLDLYEARTEYGFELIAASGDVLRDYTRGVRNRYRLQGVSSTMSDSEIRENVTRFERITTWIPKDEKLPSLNDIGKSIVIPKGCGIEQAAVFYDEQYKIEIDNEIWTALDSLSRAALIIHETDYRFLRTLARSPDSTSIDARAATASSFAQNLNPAKAGVDSSSKIFASCGSSLGGGACVDPTIGYKTVTDQANGSKTLIIQFLSIAGRPLISQTSVTLPFSLTPGLVYSINSQQLRDWTAKVTADASRGPWAAKLLIFQGMIQITEVPL